MFAISVIRRTSMVALAGAAIFAAGAAPARATNATTHYFGIVPQQSAMRLAQAWGPFIEQVSIRTGLTIRFATTKDIPTFEKCLAKGAYELAYMNPYHYVAFHEKAGYEVFAREAGKKLQGLIVARVDSPIRSLADLAGSRIAFPSPAAFGASVLPRAEMISRGITFDAHYVKSHDSVYRAVAAGVFPAGGGVRRTFHNIPEDLQSQLRVIYQTGEYTPHAFAAQPKLKKDTIDKIREAFVDVAREMPEIMAPIGIENFQAANDSDWNDIRKLGLTADQTQIVDQGNAKCHLD